MKRRGFLKALGGAAAAPLVGVPESHGVECYPMDSPLESVDAPIFDLYGEGMADLIYEVAPTQTPFVDLAYADQVARRLKELKADMEWALTRNEPK